MNIEKQKLKVLIKELDKFRAGATELVTLYIPAGYELNKAIEQIASEKSTAMNIKSKTTRKNVIAALEKILAHLRAYKKTPENGLAVFSGNVSNLEGAADVELWGIEPPEPLKQKMYRCDKVFILDALKDAFREKEIYGIIVADANDGAIGLIRGKKIEMVKEMFSLVPGKVKVGGWSQARYARIREEVLREWLQKIAEVANDAFLKEKDLRGVIIAGSGQTKDAFIKEDYLHYEIKNKILGTVDTAYSGEHGMKEALEKGEELLSEASIIREKHLMERFFTELGKNTGLALYGLREIAKALESGAVEVLLISENFDWVEATFKCSCGHADKKMIRRSLVNLKCPICGNQMTAEEKDLENQIVQKAQETQTEVEIISGESESGERLLGLGGIVAILRFKLD